MKRFFLKTPAYAPADAGTNATPAVASLPTPKEGMGYYGKPLIDHDQFGRVKMVLARNTKYSAPKTADGEKPAQAVIGNEGIVRIVKPRQDQQESAKLGSDNPMDALIGFLSYMDKNPKTLVDAHQFDIDEDAAKACLSQAKADEAAGRKINQIPPEGVVLELVAAAFAKPRLVCKLVTTLAKAPKGQKATVAYDDIA